MLTTKSGDLVLTVDERILRVLMWERVARDLDALAVRVATFAPSVPAVYRAIVHVDADEAPQMIRAQAAVYRRHAARERDALQRTPTVDWPRVCAQLDGGAR